MASRTARRIDQLPRLAVEGARLLAKLGASLLGDTCAVMLADGAILVPVAVHDRERATVERVVPFLGPMSIDRYGVVQAVLAGGEPAFGAIEVDVLRRSVTEGELAFVEAIGFHSYLVVPLSPAHGVAVFARYRPDRSRFYREHVQLAIELVETIAPRLVIDGADGGDDDGAN